MMVYDQQGEERELRKTLVVILLICASPKIYQIKESLYLRVFNPCMAF